MADDTKGAFGGVGAHPYPMDFKRAHEVREAFLAEQKRLHDEGIARRKAARKAAALAKKKEAGALPKQP